MGAFIGAHGDRSANARQRFVVACGKGLFDERDACGLAGCEVSLQIMGSP